MDGTRTNRRHATQQDANSGQSSRRPRDFGSYLATFLGRWHGGIKSLVSCTYLGGQDRWSPQVVTTGDERMEFSTDDQIAQVAA